MHFDKQTALKLDALMHPDVEEALIMLLDVVLQQEKYVLDDFDVSEARLRAFQGKSHLIGELKTYKQRLLDALR